MLATKAELASGGMTNCFFRCGLRSFFLASGQSCCRWPAQRCSAPRRCLPATARSTSPVLSAAATHQGDQFRLGRAVEDAWSGRVREMPARQDGLEAFFDQPLAGAVDRRRADIQSFHDAAVAPALARLGNVGLEQIRAFRTWAAGCLPLLIRAASVCRSSTLRRTTYFLTVASDMPQFSPPWMMLRESHGNLSGSSTQRTSSARWSQVVAEAGHRRV